MADITTSIKVNAGHVFVLNQPVTFVVEGTGIEDADEIDITLNNDRVEWVPSVIPKTAITVGPDPDDYLFNSTPVLKLYQGGAKAPRGEDGDSGLTITVNPPPPPSGGDPVGAVAIKLINTRYVLGWF